MNSVFAWTRDISQNIRLLMGADGPVKWPDIGPLLGRPFLHVQGIALPKFENGIEEKRAEYLTQAITDLLRGLYAVKVSCIYLMVARQNKVGIYLSLSDKDCTYLRALLAGRFPGITLADVPGGLADLQQNIHHCAVLQGVPSFKETVGGLECLPRTLGRGQWAYLVEAAPVELSSLDKFQKNISEQIRHVRNEYLRPSTVEQDYNPEPQFLLKLLGAVLSRCEIGQVEGSWQVTSLLLTETEEMLARGTAMLASLFSGPKSLPSPIRIRYCSPGTHDNVSSTMLSTPELSLFIQLPAEEIPGYRVEQRALFAVAVPESVSTQNVPLGTVLNQGTDTGQWLYIPHQDFTKHVLITGVTGSGKTRTCQSILDRLWKEHRTPFLVIEPVKREYRSMRFSDGHEQLRVFTLGDEMQAPFRLNPFEVPEGIHVQIHIDLLRSLFNASFAGLYPPMPYVLEQALYDTYEQNGWNLSVGVAEQGGNVPTLNDFCAEVQRIVDTSGYDVRLTQDLRTALRIRLNSLLIGAKGRMLNCRKSVPFSELVDGCTILELASIADADVMAFLIGLIFIRLYEHVVVQGPTDKLRHITLIEEAHRLFVAGLETELRSVEVSNVRGQAVSQLCNLLSEVRALGEGFVIVDQSPVKLHPDATKGTNLKIIHRLVAEDDRHAIAGSSNMADDHEAFLAILRTREAAVYAEGFHRPFLVHTPFSPALRPAQRDDLRQHMNKVFYAKYPELLGT